MTTNTLSNVTVVGELNEVNKAIATNWFAANLAPNVAQKGNELEKWIIQVSVNTATVVSVLVDTPSEETIYKFNAGTALVADTLYTMEIMISNTVTGVNVQHATTTQDVNCLIGRAQHFASINGANTP
jgi:hypothetical protein